MVRLDVGGNRDVEPALTSGAADPDHIACQQQRAAGPVHQHEQRSFGERRPLPPVDGLIRDTLIMTLGTRVCLSKSGRFVERHAEQSERRAQQLRVRPDNLVDGLQGRLDPVGVAARGLQPQQRLAQADVVRGRELLGRLAGQLGQALVLRERW